MNAGLNKNLKCHFFQVPVAFKFIMRLLMPLAGAL